MVKMEMKNVLIGLMIAGLFFSGLFGFIMALGNEYNKHYDIDQNLSYFTTDNDVSLQNMMETINQSQNDMNELNQDYENETLQETDSLFSFYAMAQRNFKNQYAQLTAFKTLAFGGSQILGIPADIVAVFVAVTLFLFVMSAIYFLLGR